jgi:catechol 2,3-dioxygenase-like lactoylglutathione lyase family enzyme
MKLRVARHTDNLEKIRSFYVDILGFEVLGQFEKHAGYDGIFIGKSGCDWHLEFTQSIEKANHRADEDDIMVLYPLNKPEYEAMIQKLSDNKIEFIPAKNPYWNENGKMCLDPDGFRIVISPLKTTS